MGFTPDDRKILECMARGGIPSVKPKKEIAAVTHAGARSVRGKGVLLLSFGSVSVMVKKGERVSSFPQARTLAATLLEHNA